MERAARHQSILSVNGIELIQKYGKYYIRSLGGMHEEHPYDLQITKDEANQILSDHEKIKEVRDSYKSKISWNFQTFIDFVIVDFLVHESCMPEKRAHENLEKLSRHKDIKMELYETIMYEVFPLHPIAVEGYSAEHLCTNTGLSTIGAYNYLVYLREDPENALKDLEEGLSTK